ncbi:hypothetical protein BGZ94_008809 [Podila epigama]|nr:hypothetical protein BGZ94_008809 [Podila epigama]
MSTIPTIHLHQTSLQAVLIIQQPDIDSTSVSASPTTDQSAVQLRYKSSVYPHGESTWTIRSRVLPIAAATESEAEAPLTATTRPTPTTTPSQTPKSIRQCSFSVSNENIVVTLTKAQPGIEWQALDVSIDQGDATAPTTHTLVKFITAANTTHLSDTIRQSNLWEDDEATGGRVTNIHATKVPGVNAIRLTADLST